MRQLFFFSVAGGVGFGTDFCVYLLLRHWLDVHSARVLAFLVAVNVTYLLNSRFTFQDRKGRYWLYVFGQGKGFLLNLAVYEGIMWVAGYSGNVPLVAFVTASVAALAFNYLYARHLVFRHRGEGD